MSQEWYCQIMGSEIGPLTSSQLREMAQSGRLTPDDLIRKGDSNRWTTASHVKGLFTTPAAPTPSPPQNQPAAPPAAPRPAATSDRTSIASSRLKNLRQQIRGRTAYASQNLMPGETILYAASIHPMIFFSSAILFLCLILGIIMVSSESPAAVALALILVGLASPYFAIKALIILLTTECVLMCCLSRNWKVVAFGLA